MTIAILSRTERLHKKVGLLRERSGSAHTVLFGATLDDARTLFQVCPEQYWLFDLTTDTEIMMMIAKQLHEEYEQSGKHRPQCIAGSLSVEPAMIQQTRLHHIDMIVPMYKFEEIIKAMIETL